MVHLQLHWLIFDFKIKLQYKQNVPEAEFPKGRIFAIDIQDQFEFARPLLQEKHELFAAKIHILRLVAKRSLEQIISSK